MFQNSNGLCGLNHTYTRSTRYKISANGEEWWALNLVDIWLHFRKINIKFSFVSIVVAKMATNKVMDKPIRGLEINGEWNHYSKVIALIIFKSVIQWDDVIVHFVDVLEFHSFVGTQLENMCLIFVLHFLNVSWINVTFLA